MENEWKAPGLTTQITFPNLKSQYAQVSKENKGPFKKYVRSEGGGGGASKAYESVRRGERGSVRKRTYALPIFLPEFL